MFSHYFFTSIIALCASFLPQNNTPNKTVFIEKTPPNTVVVVKAEGERIEFVLTDTIQTLEMRGLEIGQEYEFFLGNILNSPKSNLLLAGKDIAFPTVFKAKNTNEIFTIKTTVGRNQSLNHTCYFSYNKINNTPTAANASSRSPLAVISTVNGSSVTNLIKQVLIGTDCFEITNAVVLGNTSRWGTFANGSTSIGIGTGVVMSTGLLSSIGQPSNIQASTSSTGSYNDPVLGNLNDPIVIEFDIKPTTPILSFDYVFASEEYCQYVGSINDAFGFFISGPGITGNYNMARVNGVSCSINNVNHNTNSAFYYSNKMIGTPLIGGCTGHPNGPTTPNPASVNECVFNGFTHVLTATSPTLQTCQTYHIRLIIGDAVDKILDSAVFLKAGSFNADSYVVPSVYNATTPTSNEVKEGCENGVLKICRPPGADNTLPKNVTWTFTGSTATSGVDYTPFGTSATIPSGQDCIEIPITVLLDQVAESDEIIKITVNEGCKCAPYELVIKDSPLVVALSDVTVCPNTTVNLAPVVTGGFPPYTYAWSPSGSGNPNTFNAGALPTITNYTVTVTDFCGHIKTKTAKVTVKDIPTADLTTASAALCAGGNTTLNFNFTGTPPWSLTYTINGVAQAPITVNASPYTLTVTQPGTYAISNVKNPGSPCDGTFLGTSNVQQSNPDATTTKTNIDCNNVNNGTISLSNMTGGVAPFSYTYLWSANAGNAASQNVTNLAPGTYTVTVTDNIGCKKVKTETITQPPVLVATATASTAQTCVTQGTGTINVTGGTPTYTFLWSNGATTQNLSGATAGTYILTVTDSKGCQDTAKVTIAANNTLPTAVAVANVTVTCNTPTVTLNGTGSSTGAGISYNWSGTGITGGGTTLSPTVNAGGTYTLTVTNAANGCTEIATVNVLQNTVLPTAVAVAPPLITCGNPSISLSGAGSDVGPNFTYNWSGAGITSGGTTLSPTVNATGTYILTVTNTDNGCKKTVSVTVNEDKVLPMADAGPDKILNCINNQSVSIGGASSSGPNFTYNWSNPTNTNATQTVTTPGTYTITVTNTTNGCTKTDDVVVTEDITPPVMNPIAPVTVNCFTPTPTITTSTTGSNLVYTWTPSGSGANPTISVGGTYTVTVTNSVNGCKDIKTVVVPEDKNDPIAMIAPPAELNCNNNSSIALDPTSTSTGANFSYNWAGPGLSSTSLIPPNVSSPGTYSLTVTNTDNGCKKIKSVTVTQNIVEPTPANMLPQTLNCYNNGQVTIGGNATGGTNLTYLWNNNATTPTQTVTTPGIFTITVTNADNGCKKTASVTISEDKTNPTANAGNPALINCYNSVVTLTGTAGGGTPLTYAWSGPGITGGGSSLTPTVNVAGTYILTVTNTTNGCKETSQVSVTEDKILPTAVIAPPTKIDCNNLTATLDASASSSGANFTYNWSGPGGFTNSTTNPTVNVGGVYIITVTNTTNGCTKTATVTVDEDKTPPNAVAGNPQTLNCYNATLTLNGAGSSIGTNFSYNWSSTNGGNIVGGGTTLTPTIDKAGTYILTVTNTTTGCTKTAQVVISEDKVKPIANITGSGTITCNVPTIALGVNVTSGTNLVFQWATVGGNITSSSSLQNITVNQGGTYNVTITNATNGCTTSDQVIIGSDNQAPTVTAIPSGAINCNNPAIEIDGSGSSQGGNFTYNWTGPNSYSNNSTLKPLVSVGGAYTLNITNTTNGCINSKTVIVSDDKILPIVSLGTPSLLTCTNSVVTIFGSATNGGSYLYNWTTPNGNITAGATTISPSVDNAGIYNLAVINSTNGCQATFSVAVFEDKVLPIATVAAAAPLTCAQPQAILNGAGSSTGTNIIYNWTANNGAFIFANGSIQLTVAQAAIYTLTVKNTTNGCTASAQVTVIDNRVVPFAAAQASSDLSCTVLQTQLGANGSSTGAIYTYQWTTTNGNIVSGATTSSPTIDKGGTYSLIVTNTDNACTAISNVNVQQNIVLPTVNAGAAKIISCTSATVQLEGSGSSGFQYVYQWKGPGGNVPNGSGGNTATPSVSQIGTYKLIITNTQTGCKDSSSTNVTLDQNVPVANAGTQKIIDCNISSVQLDGSGSSTGTQFTFTWTTPNGAFSSGQNTLQPTVNKPGTYNLKVKNTVNGCEGNATVEVVDNRIKPTIVVAKPKLLNCANPSATLNGAGSSLGANFTYLWTNNANGIVSGATTLTPVINKAGMYVLKIKNIQNGCERDTSITVLENYNTPVPNVAAPTLLTCTQPTTILDASASTKIQNANYQWIVSAGGNIVSGATTLKPKIDNSGDYKLILTDTISLCKDSITVKVLKDANIPTASAGATAELNCTVKTLDLKGVASAGATITYSWTTLGGNIVSGATTLTPKVNKGGTYTLKVYNSANQCEATSTVTITQDTILPTVAIAKPAILNCKNTVTPVNASASSQGTNFQFAWNIPAAAIVSGANSLSPLVKLPGVYSITITNTKTNCVAKNTVTIEQDIVKPQADISKTDTLNCRNLSLKLKGKASANSGFYTFIWNTPPNGIIKDGTTLEPIINQPGNYQLVVTDTVNFCPSTAQITVIKDVITPVVDAGSDGNLTCVVKNLTLTGTATNGNIADFIYIWTTSNGNIVGATNGKTIKIDNAGKYYFEVENKINGCKSKDSTSITQDANVPKVEILTNGDLDCKTTTLLLDGSGSSQGGGLTFIWTAKNGGNFVSGQNTLKPIVNSAGVYTLQITNPNNNCVKDIEKTINIDTIKPVINIIKEVLTCAKTKINVEAKIFKATNFTLNWTSVNGNILTKKDSLQILVDKKGLYKITVKNNINECESSVDADILEDKVLPITDAGAQLEINCQDSILTLQGDKSSKGADFVYNWTTQNGFILSGEKTLSPKINLAGDYFLLITNKNNGCQNKDTVNIKVNKILPKITTLKPDTLTCKKTQVDISATSTATGNAQFSWSGASIISDKTKAKIQVNRPGIYELIITDDKNKCQSKANTNVPQDTIRPTVNAGINIELDCKNPTIEVQGSATGNNLVYQWTTVNGTIVTNDTKPKATVKSAGIYKLQVTNSVTGCTSNDEMEVTFLGAPKAIVATPQVLTCEKTTVTIDSKGSDTGANFTYTWSDPTGKTIGTNPILQVTNPGTYNFKVYNSTNNCEIKIQVPVNQDIVKPFADAGLGGVIDCERGYVILNGNKSSKGAKFTYLWSGGQIVSGNTTTEAKVTAEAIYSLTVTNTENACTSTDTVSVLSLKPALLEVQPKNPLCAGGLGAIEFKKVSGGTPPFSYSVDGGGNFFPNIFYTNLRAGNYKTIVQDAKGCEDTVEVKITDPAKLKLNIANVHNVKIGDDVQLKATLIPDFPPVKDITWTPDTVLSCKKCLDPIVVQPKKDIIYKIKVKNENGCEAETSTNILIDHFIPIYVPTMFSPNDDNINDRLIVFGNPKLVIKIKSFRIFDRWGDMVYQERDILINDLPKGWDGTLGTKPMNPAVFIWVAEVEFIDGQTKDFKGEVTLTR